MYPYCLFALGTWAKRRQGDVDHLADHVQTIFDSTAQVNPDFYSTLKIITRFGTHEMHCFNPSNAVT